MFLKYTLPVIIAVTLSFKKKEAAESATELLTQKPWILVSYGFDENANGIIDASEESICDCEKDNNYNFNRDGTGVYEENTLSCANGISEMPFTWKLINDETSLDFLFGRAKISWLTSEQLIILYDITDIKKQSARYIQIFKHS